MGFVFDINEIVGTSMMMTPLIIFLVIVAPIWIAFHYTTKRKKSEGLSAEDHTRLQQLSSNIDRMADRVSNLESILDSEAPQWRNKHEQR